MTRKTIWLFVILLTIVHGGGINKAHSAHPETYSKKLEFCGFELLEYITMYCNSYYQANEHYVESIEEMYQALGERFFDKNVGPSQDYSCYVKVLRADKDGYHIVLISGSWRKFECSSDFEKPRLYFESEEDKARMKQAFNEDFKELTLYLKREILFPFLVFFPDTQTKLTLVKSLLQYPDKPFYKKAVLHALRKIVAPGDDSTANGLHEVLGKAEMKDKLNDYDIRQIVRILGKIKSKTSLKHLRQISSSSKCSFDTQWEATATINRINKTGK